MNLCFLVGCEFSFKVAFCSLSLSLFLSLSFSTILLHYTQL